MHVPMHLLGNFSLFIHVVDDDVLVFSNVDEEAQKSDPSTPFISTASTDRARVYCPFTAPSRIVEFPLLVSQYVEIYRATQLPNGGTFVAYHITALEGELATSCGQNGDYPQYERCHSAYLPFR